MKNIEINLSKNLTSKPISEDVSTDEENLVQAAKTNPDAFDVLYRRYVLRIYRYLCLRVPNEEEAADLTQHVFIQVFEALPKYQERNLPFSAWLFRIARNAAIDSYRKKRRNNFVEFVPDPSSQLISQLDPESLILQTERQQQVRKLISKLDSNKRELLALRFASDLTISEIAVVVGKSEAAIRKQLTRIITELRKQYKEQY